ncbi:AbrB/MazE/SpoVT family DNA-binding domain-containing protein [Longibacter salinarum]|uniref:AbrB/MazE/SpoVT family DNA-binding domain-containing protein n=1 Tax=Longibacter salinarum TaxID=1850348 RepID=A0A2A8D0J3_9BACT|nr:AbrB/MazE/SpoVT family DNA-binding domain-containing protein [Longibacter salinarum]PEN14168.1 AbrB/MazE/SpoVT family DNA-binding domain-containing protein [Longibacter salinarum]
MPTVSVIERVDGDLQVAIPEDMLDHRHLEEGDRVHVIETSSGILIVPFDADFEEAMTFYNESKAEYSDVLRALSG